MVDFLNGNTLTEEGQATIVFIEERIAEAVKQYNASGDLNHINGLAGNYRHYYVHVLEGKMATREEWARDHSHGMQGAHADMQHLQEQAATAAAAVDAQEATKTLADQIAELSARLTEATDQIAEQQAQIETLEATKSNKRKPPKSQAEPAEPAAETTAEDGADTSDEGEGA